MNPYMNINIHLDEETRLTAHRSGRAVWISIGDVVALFITDENQLGELAGALDQASSLLVD